jgi:hypothetical protein
MPEGQRTPSWLCCSTDVVDRGRRAARFPYDDYQPIKTEDDCVAATGDVTEKWDESFRPFLTTSLCKFIALLNQSNRFQTTHTVTGSEDPQKVRGYEWATNSLGVSITVIFRETQARYAIDEHVRAVRELSRLITATPFDGDSTGWLLGVWPEAVMYQHPQGGQDIGGYGVELRAAAFANNESRAAERLSRLLLWIHEVLSRSKGSAGGSEARTTRSS